MIAVRPATEADLDAMERIQMMSPEAAQWPVGEYLGYEIWIAETHEEVAGFLVLQRIADGESEVLNLAVAPHMRRMGIGQLLLERLPAGATYLEVRASNLRAIRLYERCGFRETGVRKNYYHSPVEDAIVLHVQK